MSWMIRYKRGRQFVHISVHHTTVIRRGEWKDAIKKNFGNCIIRVWTGFIWDQ